MGPGQKLQDYSTGSSPTVDYTLIMQKRRDAELEKMRQMQDMETAKAHVYGKPAEANVGAPATNQYAQAASGAADVAASGGAGNVATAGLGGAAGGAMLGSALFTSTAGGVTTGAAAGPIGAAIGAGVGITGALMAQRAAAKKRAADAEAEKFQNVAKIEQDTEITRQNAMTNMVAALRSAFTRG